MAQLLDPVRLGTLFNVVFPTVTFTDSGDLVNRASHGLGNGTAITFNSITDTTGISVDTTYYVKSATTNTFKLALTSGGTTIALSTNGTGKLAPFIDTSGVASIDGVVPVAGMRILLKAQTDRRENGIYDIETNNRLVRAIGFKYADVIISSTAVFIQDGSTLANTGWTIVSSQNSPDNLSSPNDDITTIIVGSDPMLFERFSVNLKLETQDIPSAILLRATKGYPLTIQELDNNFKYLSQTLNLKLNIVDFTRTAVKNKLNLLETYTDNNQTLIRSKEWQCEDNNLNAWQLRGWGPSTIAVETETTGVYSQSVALRDTNGDITTVNFRGHLIGYADDATNADHADVATDVDGVVTIAHGGTNSTNDADARSALGVVALAGDFMAGKLVMAQGKNSYASMNIPVASADPVSPVVGDIWASSTGIKYYLNGVKQEAAPINSPTFTGDAKITDNLGKTSNSSSIASTRFVQLHVTDLNTAINLKAAIESPVFTGNARAVTAATSDNDTSIATTEFVLNKINSVLPDYYTSAQTDNVVAVEATARSNADTNLQSQIDDVKNTVGIPVGSVMYYTATTIPAGWLECNGAAIGTTAYAVLFDKIGYSYGGTGNLFRLPDLRGEFIRGLDNGRQIDPNRTVGSWQKSSVVPFDPSLDSRNPSGLISPDNGDRTTNVRRAGFDAVDYTLYANDVLLTQGPYNAAAPTYALNQYGWEAGGTRPRNVALVPCIKAFGAVDDPDLINATAVLVDVSRKLDKRGDAMTGPLTLNGAPTSALHAATKAYVDNVTLLPGPTGPAGVQGPVGVQGPTGPAGPSITVTYGNTQYSQSGFTNQVGSWNNDANWFDVYPPAGKTMNNLIAFLPSIAVIHYAGGVDGNDSMRCTWAAYSTNIRVWVQNTEQRSTPAANWIAFWS